MSFKKIVWICCSFLLGSIPKARGHIRTLSCQDLLGGQLEASPNSSVSLVCEQALIRCLALQYLMYQIQTNPSKDFKIRLLKMISDTDSDRVFWLTACHQGYLCAKEGYIQENYGPETSSVDMQNSSMSSSVV